MRLFSLVALKRRHSKWLLRSHGLQPYVVSLPNGFKIHCWAPSSSHPLNSAACTPDTPLLEDRGLNLPHESAAASLNANKQILVQPPPSKPALLLLHGFGPDGSIAWDNQVAELSKHFSLYLPDLLFFGLSSPDAQAQHTRSTDAGKEDVRYSEIFQAKCMHKAMRELGVQEAVVLGHSYGGFVAYHMAHMYPGFVKKLVIVSSGIMMNPHTNDRLLSKFGTTHIHDMLVPPTLPFFIKSLQLVFNDFLPTWLPSFLYRDMYESLDGDREGKLQLVDDIILGKEGAPPLPTIEQSTLIIWGEEDQIFDISLACQLKEFLGAKATLSTIKGAGHVPHMVNPKEFNRLLLSYLLATE